MSKRKSTGRTPGSQSKDYSTTSTTATRCPACESTDRTPYTRKHVLESSGTAPDGQPCTHVVLQWTSCKGCGQHRIDRTHENRK